MGTLQVVSCNVGLFSLLVLHSVYQETNRKKPGHLEQYCFPLFYCHYPSKKKFQQMHALRQTFCTFCSCTSVS